MANWRSQVAALLVEAGKALARRSDRQAAAELGTAFAYLEKASAAGDATATDLLRQIRDAAPEQETARFSFSPGELEELRQRNRGA